MVGGNSTPSPEGQASPSSDDAFQKLLLRIAAKAAERADATALIQLFCRASRDFFQVSGVYFWRRLSGDELVGEQADGKLADRFIGLRLLQIRGGNVGKLHNRDFLVEQCRKTGGGPLRDAWSSLVQHLITTG